MGMDAPQMEDAAMIRTSPMRAAVSVPLLALAAGCNLGGGAGQRPPGDEPPPPEVTLYGVRMQHFRGEDLATSGRAAKLTYVRTTGELTAYESVFRFPNRGGQAKGRAAPQPGIDVRAPVVVGSLSTRQARAEGGVYMRGADGMIAQTERVFFDGVAMVARGDSPARVETPGYTMSADTFTLDFVPEIFTFEGNVETALGRDP